MEESRTQKTQANCTLELIDLNSVKTQNAKDIQFFEIFFIA